MADKTTKDEIEQLIVGEAVEKRIRLDLTYDEIDNSIDNCGVFFLQPDISQKW